MIETNLKRLNTFNSQGYLVLDDNETKKALNLKNAIREIMYKKVREYNFQLFKKYRYRCYI